MSAPTRLTRVIVALASWISSGHATREFMTDLMEDQRRIRAKRGQMAALWSLLHELLSLSHIVAAAAAAYVGRLVPRIWRDTRHALRSLRRRPAASLSAAAMLAAGVASVTIALALASTLLFRPISERYPHQVQRLGVMSQAGRISLRFSEVELNQLRPQLDGAASVAALSLQPVMLRTGGADRQALAEVVSGNYFSVIGREAVIGRILLDPDEAPGASPVAVISDSFWRRQFRGDAGVLGTEVQLNSRSFTIVGVAAGIGSSAFLGASVDAWITTAHADALLNRDWRTNAANREWTALVRSDDPKRGALRARLDRMTPVLAMLLPDPWRDRHLVTLPGTVMAGSQRAAAESLSWILVGLSALILLAGGANVGGLVLASAAADRTRAAIVLSLGAGRATLIRRQLIEGAVIGLAGGMGALALYLWARRLMADITLLPTLSLRLDLPSGFAMGGATLAAGILVGLVVSCGPALWSARVDLVRALRGGAERSTTASGGMARARRWLVSAQVAISLTLITGAVLFSRSLSAVVASDVGFPRAGLVAFDFDVEPTGQNARTLPALAREALLRVSALPGVSGAAMSSRAPIDASTPVAEIRTPGLPARAVPDVTFYLASPSYFDVVGVALTRGRPFTEIDAQSGADVAIVNQTLAARLWPGEDAIDWTLVLHPEGRTVRVVGVARDSKYRSLSEPNRPHFYLPTAPGFGLTLLVRTSGDPRSIIDAVERSLSQVGPGVVGFFPRTMDDHLAIDVLPIEAAARSASGLGALALALSAAGLYGIVMWFVETRRREIGVRLALGASPADVRRLVMREALAAAGPGLMIGLALATGLFAVARSLLSGVGPLDPVALLFAVASLMAVVALASYWPSRRATHIDPIIVLRDS